MKYRSGYKTVKTLRKYVNGKPTNITKANVFGQPDYIEKYLSDTCPVNSLPSGVSKTIVNATAPTMPNPTQTQSEDNTLTFSEYVNGWTSFHSWIPESMVNMNGDFFTFKNGQLYKHHASEDSRSIFYGTRHDTEIEFIANDGASDVKIFKTLEVEGNTKDFDVTITTDLDAGHIDKESFEKKEGFNYAYIRRNESDEADTDLLSVAGIGSNMGGTKSGSVLTVQFSDLPSNISINDTLYQQLSNGTSYKIGKISTVTTDSGGLKVLTISSATNIAHLGATFGTNGFWYVAKNPIAESFGLKGYFAKIKLVNQGTNKVELFAVNSEISKSFP